MSGHGGQVLLSKATRGLIDGLELRDLGEHRVKDFDRPVWEGEREAFAAAVVTERPGFERGRSEGRRLSLEEAVEYALDSID